MILSAASSGSMSNPSPGRLRLVIDLPLHRAILLRSMLAAAERSGSILRGAWEVVTDGGGDVSIRLADDGPEPQSILLTCHRRLSVREPERLVLDWPVRSSVLFQALNEISDSLSAPTRNDHSSISTADEGTRRGLELASRYMALRRAGCRRVAFRKGGQTLALVDLSTDQLYASRALANGPNAVSLEALLERILDSTVQPSSVDARALGLSPVCPASSLLWAIGVRAAGAGYLPELDPGQPLALRGYPHPAVRGPAIWRTMCAALIEAPVTLDELERRFPTERPSLARFVNGCETAGYLARADQSRRKRAPERTTLAQAAKSDGLAVGSSWRSLVRAIRTAIGIGHAA